MSSEDESKILCREIGKLVGPVAGIGARWAAGRLPSVAHEASMELRTQPGELQEFVIEVLQELPKTRPGLSVTANGSEVSAIIGSGIRNMNPTLVRITIRAAVDGALLHLRAVAKEGLLPQRSAELASAAFMEALKQRLLGK